MNYQRHDNKNPGSAGVYQISRVSDRVWYRRWNGKDWFKDRLSIKEAWGETEPAPGVSASTWGTDIKCTYVADLAGNLVSPRTARFIGEPLWEIAFEPTQLELFE